MMVNFNTLQIKQFSNRRQFSSLISNKSNFAFLSNYQTSTKFSLYTIKKNNFAENLPRHVKILMPNLSPHGMTQGKILLWKKNIGDKITEGEAIASVETDKSVMDFEVNEDGYLAAVLVPADKDKYVKVGDAVAIIVEEKSDVEAFRNYGQQGVAQQSGGQTTSSATKEEKAQQVASQQKKSAKKLPTAIKLNMPTLSPTMKKGNIVEWKKKVGDQVKEGDVLAAIETDKAQVDFEMTENAYVARLLFPDGAKDVNVGELVAILVENPEDVEAYKDYTEGAELAVEEVPVPPQEEQPAKKTETKQTDERIIASPLAKKTARERSIDFSGVEGTGPKGRILQADVLSATISNSQQGEPERVFISPLARKTANEKGIDFNKIQGTGPRGRIIQADVLEAKLEKPQISKPVEHYTTTKLEQVQKSQEILKPQEVQKPVPPKPVQASADKTSAVPDYEDLEISGVRRVIAERLALSKSTIPHFYISSDLNTDKISNLRIELNKYSPVKISFNDIIVKAASLACMKVPETNSSWQETFIRKYKNVDMSVAVQTEHGLITPIIKNSNLKGLSQISKEVKELAEKAKQRKLKPEEFIGGTFTISNMGMFGITNFTAVINPPQVCILAVGKMEKKLVLDENATDKNSPYKVVNIMNVTLSSDHRVVDGAYAAQWMQEFKNLIENPELMLL